MTFECNTSEETPYWTFTIPGLSAILSTEPEHNSPELNGLDLTFFSTEGFTNISFPRIAEYNGTDLYCAISSGSSTEFHNDRDPIDLTIVGKSIPIVATKHFQSYWSCFFRSSSTSRSCYNISSTISARNSVECPLFS